MTEALQLEGVKDRAHGLVGYPRLYVPSVAKRQCSHLTVEGCLVHGSIDQVEPEDYEGKAEVSHDRSDLPAGSALNLSPFLAFNCVAQVVLG